MNQRLTDSFRHACGLVGSLVLDVDTADKGRVESLALDKPFAVVGREAGIDLVLDDRDVSRAHAYFQVIAGRVFCVDLHSRTKVWWGNEPAAWGWVGSGQVVQIGPFSVQPRVGGTVPSVDLAVGTSAAGPFPISRSFGPAFPVEAALEVIDRVAYPPAWRLGRALVLAGRSPSCKVQLAGRGVGGMHAGFFRAPDTLWVVDLRGPGGIEVNGKTVPWARLNEGDVIRIGPYHLRAVFGTEAERLLKPSSLPALRNHEPKNEETDIAPRTVVMSPTVREHGVVNPTVRALLDEMSAMQKQTADQFQLAIQTMLKIFDGMHRDQLAVIRDEIMRLQHVSTGHQGESDVLKRNLPVEPADRPQLRIVSGDGTPPSSLNGPATPKITREPARAGPSAPGSVLPGSEIHEEIVRKLSALQRERQGRWQHLLKTLIGGSGTGFSD